MRTGYVGANVVTASYSASFAGRFLQIEGYSAAICDINGILLFAAGTFIQSGGSETYRGGDQRRGVMDNDSANGADPIDDTNFFVRQQYIDFRRNPRQRLRGGAGVHCEVENNTRQTAGVTLPNQQDLIDSLDNNINRCRTLFPCGEFACRRQSIRGPSESAIRELRSRPASARPSLRTGWPQARARA